MADYTKVNVNRMEKDNAHTKILYVAFLYIRPSLYY
jgi:hypothetical protein